MGASGNNGVLYNQYKNRTYKFKIGSHLKQNIHYDKRYHHIFSGYENEGIRFPYYNRVSILNIY